MSNNFLYLYIRKRTYILLCIYRSRPRRERERERERERVAFPLTSSSEVHISLSLRLSVHAYSLYCSSSSFFFLEPQSRLRFQATGIDEPKSKGWQFAQNDLTWSEFVFCLSLILAEGEEKLRARVSFQTLQCVTILSIYLDTVAALLTVNLQKKNIEFLFCVWLPFHTCFGLLVWYF